ncbi:MAG TPA: efflux RND transporter periplasmic adaptor subunit [Thermoanaerobaculia bacterium]|nr:efflux RND transporter periplasmic adaptor subunit [Thermoanaerobaculia bacterium]
MQIASRFRSARRGASTLSFPCLSTQWLPATRHSAALVGLSLLLTACAEPPAQQAPPPPEVSVVVADPQPVVNRFELPGRLQAVRTAEVRARVDGIVQRRLYEEGTDVDAGQPLFGIDPSELRAELAAAEAALARAEATAANATQDVERYRGLVAQQAISQQEYDTAVARQRTAQADVAQARARVQAARLDLGYTTVRAPISGRAGRAQVTEGALVSAASATLLTTIEQIDPIYANFSLSSAELLKVRQGIASGEIEMPELGRVQVRLVLEDGTLYGPTGHLDFLDLAINETTGTTALRADFPNPESTLLPGQFVRVRIDAGVRPAALLIPQRAVTVTPQGASVMVVGDDDVVENRPVKLGALQGDSWLIEEGLSGGERVVVAGIQKVQPGQPVRVTSDGAPAAGGPEAGQDAAAGAAPAADPGADER